MYEDICVPLGCCNPFHDHTDESRLSRLVDTEDPAFDHIAEVLADMAGSGVEFTPEIVAAAVKMGRLKHSRDDLPRAIAPVEKRWKHTGQPVVYYIRRGNLIKIGTTMRLRSRLTALMPDEVLALEPGDEITERQRHRQFAALRADPRGEYFFPGAALQEHVSRVRVAHGAPPADLPTLQGASRAWARDLEETDLAV